MEGKLYQQRGFYPTLLISLLIIAVTLITHFRQDLFVQETGKFKIFGSLWIILSIGLILRWKYVYRILGFLTLFVLVVVIPLPFFVDKKYLVNHLIIIATLILITYLLFLSKSVKSYVNRQ